MKKIYCLVSMLLVFACFIPAAPGQAPTGKIMTLTDEASLEPGKMVVTDYYGPLPATGPGSRAITQMPNWPRSMGGHPNFAPSRGLVFADLDRDGLLEIITSSTDKKIYAWDYTGTPMPGFPVTTIELPQYPPSVADLDGDGDMEIVQFTRGTTSGGRFYILDHEGNVLPGFPKSINNNNISGTPSLHDLDNDGSLEILVPERDYPVGYLHVFEMDGTEWGGNWPALLDHVPTGCAAVGDIDDDGKPEIIYLSYNSMYAFEKDGSVMAGWPVQITNANFSYQSPALADLNGNGYLEIVVGTHKDAPGCHVYDYKGRKVTGWPKLVQTWSYCAPTVTDLEGDGTLDILLGQAGYFSGYSNCFWAWNASGAVRPGFPYGASTGGGSEGPLTVADINNDGLMEIFADYNIKDGTSGEGYLFGVDSNGNDLPDFPLRPLGWTYLNSATIGDVDGDGDYELGVLSRHDTGVHVNLYDLPGAYHPSDVSWETYHNHNARGGLRGGEDRLHLHGDFALNSPISVYLHDTPGHKAFLLMSATTQKTYLHPLGWLQLGFAPVFLTLAFNATIPANGQFELSGTIPNDPSYVGVGLYFQGVVGADPGMGEGAVTVMRSVILH